MHLVRKIRACLISFILVLSSLSLFIITAEETKADDFDIEEFFIILAGFHPYITAGMYVNDGNETIHIKGDIVFDLFYSTTFSSQWKYKDAVKVKLYTWNETLPMEIENGSTQATLEPELLGEIVQNSQIKIEGMDFKLYPGQYLIVTVEIIQSGKPIGNIIEKRYERKLKSNLHKVGDFLNRSSTVELQELGAIIMEILDITENEGITAAEIASLVNSFSASSFVYNSSNYPSSIMLPVKSDENLTLYFHSTLYDLESEADFLVELTNKSINGTARTWPTRIINPETSNIETFDYLLWFGAWIEYISSNQPIEPEDEDKVIYYITSDGKLTLSKPEGHSPLRIFLNKPKKWEGISVDRNKIIKNATAELYLYYPKYVYLRKTSVDVSIFDETTGKVLASAIKPIEKSSILELIQGGPDLPTILELDVFDSELWYDHNISLRISATKAPRFPFSGVLLNCNSFNYQSSVTFRFEETDNIKITDNSKYKDYEEENKKYIIAGGSAEFIYNISSKYEEEVKINVDPIDSFGLSNINFDYPKSVDISENGSATVHLYVNSTEDSLSAYGHYVDFFFNVSGLTGFDSKNPYVEIFDNAVEYDINVIAPKGKEIKHGETGTYSIIVRNNNTGFWSDSYYVEVESEHNWSVSFESDIPELKTFYDTEDQYVLKVNVSIPEFTEKLSDKLTIIIYSNEAEGHGMEEEVTIVITTNVIAPNVLEHIYHFFDGVAKDIGLDEALGNYAAAFLIFILVFIIIIFLILIIFLLRRKYVEVICFDRIKDISPDDEASYDITITNPLKKELTYTINTVMESESEGWDVSLDKTQVTIGPRGSVPLTLTVKTTDYIKSDDWIEIKVIAKLTGKEKSDEISTVTSIIEGKPELNFIGVFHWPRLFKKGNRIETSFRIRNRGNVSANNINVILIINGKEKNKVEDITIPRGGYAEIEIPWIAVKGKNKIDIVVK